MLSQIVFAHCSYGARTPTHAVPVPDWQCYALTGVFVLGFGTYAALLILAPDRMQIAGMSNLGDLTNPAKRVMGAICLAVVLWMAKLFLASM